jgi:biuret amidohydrolase
MKAIEIEDHDATLTALKKYLQVDPKKTAVVTVDMHRGHLDPVEATLPAPFEESRRVCENSRDLLTFAKAEGIPVVHVIAVFRKEEVNKINPRIAAQVVLSRGAPKTDAQRRGVPHNLIGSIQTQLMPEIGPEAGDYIIDNKKTFSIFQGTDLEHLLRIVLEVDTVVLMGINTNTCVQCGAFESFNLGYKTIVISDCVASMYGQDLHLLGLQNISRCLGWVLTVNEFKEKVKAFPKP